MYLMHLLCNRTLIFSQRPLVEKGSKVEEFLRAQDKQMQEAKDQVHELQEELSAATKRRTVGDLQISQLRDQYNKNIELLSSRVSACLSTKHCPR
jgi:septal ring factor EnvC (AmiA/AmiB activator)